MDDLKQLDVRVRYASAVLLDTLARDKVQLSTYLEDDDQHLEPMLDWLHNKEYLSISEESLYVVTASGRKAWERFKARYREFLRTMDVYSAVDLAGGEFAFERFFDFEDEEDWQDWLNEERFLDLRLAVAGFKKLDLVEVVLMAALSDEFLSTEESGWQFRLLSDEFWGEMQAFIDGAISVADLADEEDGEAVDGDQVLLEVIRAGAELNVRLKKEEDKLSQEGSESESAENEEEYTVEEYVSYQDPYYVAPVWGGVWFF